MKRRFFIVIVFIIFTWGCLPVLARDTDPRVEKRKTYTKTYALSGNDKVALNNQFGEMKINTWEKNEIKVDVTIVAKASSDEVAQNILDNISIEDGKIVGGVYFKTNLENKMSRWQKGDKKEYKEQSMNINYLVYMPPNNPLVVDNKFGPIVLPDMVGRVDINSEFGSLKAGKLGNVGEISLKFGYGDIASISGGKINIEFATKPVHIQKLSGDILLNIHHSKGSNGVIIILDNSISSLRLNSEFSNLEIKVPKDISADFDISTHFGSFKNKANFAIKQETEEKKERKYGPKFEYRYKGQVGNGRIVVRIKSNFSDIELI